MESKLELKSKYSKWPKATMRNSPDQKQLKSAEETQKNQQDFKPHFYLNYSSSQINEEINLPSHNHPQKTIRKYPCEKCPKEFKAKNALIRHAEVHSTKRPHKCHCGLTYKRISHLERHLATFHSKDLFDERSTSEQKYTEDILTIKGCATVLDGRDDQPQRHLEKMAGDEQFDKEFSGDQIPEDDKELLQLLQADQKLPPIFPPPPEMTPTPLQNNPIPQVFYGDVHRNIFPCNECPKSFNQIHILKRHQLLHSKVKLFKCRFCDRRFHRPDGVKSHTFWKHKDKEDYQNAFYCGKCEVSFVSMFELNKHRSDSPEVHDIPLQSARPKSKRPHYTACLKILKEKYSDHQAEAIQSNKFEKDSPHKEFSEKDAPFKEFSEKDAPFKEFSEKDSPYKEFSEKDSPEDNKKLLQVLPPMLPPPSKMTPTTLQRNQFPPILPTSKPPASQRTQTSRPIPDLIPIPLSFQAPILSSPPPPSNPGNIFPIRVNESIFNIPQLLPFPKESLKNLPERPPSYFPAWHPIAYGTNKQNLC